MEDLGKPVVITGPNGDRFGDVIDVRFKPLIFCIIYHDNLFAERVEGWRVRDISDRKPKQVIPTSGPDFYPSLPRDEVVRRLQDVDNQRNIRGWLLLADVLVEHLHVAPGPLTGELLLQAAMDGNTTTLSMAKSVSTVFRTWGRVVPRSAAVCPTCPSCGLDVAFNPVETERVHRLQCDSAMVVTVRCVCNRFVVVNRSAAELEHIGVTF